MSWTGSEAQRRAYSGKCELRRRPPVSVPRFNIPKGTSVVVSRVSPLRWQKYVTKKELSFERYEDYEDRTYQFRERGFLIRVHRSRVVHRDDLPGRGAGPKSRGEG